MRLNAGPGIATAALAGLAVGYVLHEVRAAVRERHAIDSIDSQLVLLLDLLARRADHVRIVRTGRPSPDAASSGPGPD